MNGVILIKQTLKCPLCGKYKPKKSLCCTQCIGVNGNRSENTIKAAERRLELLDRGLHGVLTEMVESAL